MILRATVFCWVVVLLAWMPAQAQPVISAQSGLIHFSEGAVSLDGAPLSQSFGKFAQMKDGSELATRDGRAEVMLTPGVYLRLGQDTTIRMLSNRLADTRLEFLTGAAIVDWTNGSAKAPVAMLYEGYQVQLRKAGRYRFDTIPAELRVESGDAEVLHDGKSTVVDAQSVFSFVSGHAAQSTYDGPTDSLDNWNRARSTFITESNTEAGKATDLSAAIDSWENDPNAMLGALGMSAYVPRPLSLYPPVSGYSGYSTLPGGIGLNRLSLYPLPIYRYYPYSTLYGGPSYLGSSPFPRGPGYLGSSPYPTYRGGGGGTYHSPVGSHPVNPVHRGPGSIGHVGGGHR
jgi:hypothetical protein